MTKNHEQFVTVGSLSVCLPAKELFRARLAPGSDTGSRSHTDPELFHNRCRQTVTRSWRPTPELLSCLAPMPRRWRSRDHSRMARTQWSRRNPKPRRRLTPRLQPHRAAHSEIQRERVMISEVSPSEVLDQDGVVNTTYLRRVCFFSSKAPRGIKFFSKQDTHFSYLGINTTFNFNMHINNKLLFVC